MPRRSSSGKVYDLIAPVYGKLVTPRVERTLFRAVQRVAAGRPQSVLEVAVGPGASFPLLDRKIPEAWTVAVDISRKMLRQARRHARKTDLKPALVQGDAIQLPFADASFDAVLSTFLLDLVPPEDLGRSLDEMVRVLTPGGRIVLAQLNVDSGLLEKVWKVAYRVMPRSVGLWRPVDVSGSFRTSGLRILQEEKIEETVGTRVTTLVKVRG